MQLTLSTFLTSLLATSALACAPSQPAKKDDNTVTIKLFSDGDCCNAFQTTSMGVVNSCHTSSQAFNTFTLAVGQNMFNRGLRLMTFSDSNCQQQEGESVLTNTLECWHVAPAVGKNSFKIAPAN